MALLDSGPSGADDAAQLDRPVRGARVIFRVAGTGEELPCSRPGRTLFGATFFVLAPEHPLVEKLADSDEVREYVRHAQARSAVEREKKEKDGVFTGRYAVNPVNGEEIPIWVADYVLMEYGTGAIMAVPPTTSATGVRRALRAPDPSGGQAQ